MLTDPFDQQLTDLLKAARPLPPPGWRSQALAALADIHPRRHPNLLTVIIVAALILLLAAALFAAVRYFFVEGTLHFHDVRFGGVPPQEYGVAGRFLSGELEWSTDTRASIEGDFSPVSGKVVSWYEDGLPPTRADIFVCDPDWSDLVFPTMIAGLGGVNCDPKWSPDGTMIAFLHCDPVDGLPHCRAGFHAWVMNADGSDAHQVMPEGSLPTRAPSWSPDGSRLLFWLGEWGDWHGEQVGAVTTDIWGSDIQVLPNVGQDGKWSPDGTMIISESPTRGQLNGRPGQWNQVILTNADGTDPRVLVEQFVADADVREHYPREDQLASRPDVDLWINDVQYWAGPCKSVWSPTGRQIAFLAALPFDPDGPFHKDQTEVWVYDLTTDELIRVTDDDLGQTNIIWK
jgi:hypothetical protein